LTRTRLADSRRTGLAARLALTAAQAIALVFHSIAAPAQEAASPSGPWLATQAMGTALASALAAAKADLTWTKGIGLHDQGPCLIGVHLAKGSTYKTTLALQKGVKYRIHAYAGSTPDASVALVDGSGRKVAVSSPREDAGAVLSHKPKEDLTCTLTLAYSGSQAGVQACAYVVLREGGAPVSARAIETTMLTLAERLTTLSSSFPGGHFLPTDGQPAVLAGVLAQGASRTLDGLVFPGGSNCILAAGDSLASDVDIVVTASRSSVAQTAPDPAAAPNSETLRFEGTGPFSVKVTNVASGGPSFVVGLFLTSGGATVASAAPSGAASPEPPAFAKAVNQAVRHGMSIAAFIADEAENRLADGPSIMAGMLTDGRVFRAPRILLPGVTYTIVACGDEGVGQVQLAIYDMHGDPMGSVTQSEGFSYAVFKPQSVDNIYTIEVKQARSTGGRHACAALTFRQAGAGLSYADVRRSLDSLNSALARAASSAPGAISFNDMGGQVSLYGTVLSPTESRTYTDVGLPVGDHVFLGAADDRVKDLGITVSSSDGLTEVKDKDASPTPVVSYNGVGNVNVKVVSQKASEPAMTMLAILNVSAAK
jgi:hypothetical protein